VLLPRDSRPFVPTTRSGRWSASGLKSSIEVVTSDAASARFLSLPGHFVSSNGVATTTTNATDREERIREQRRALAGRPWRLPVPRLPPPRALRRQGQVAEEARPEPLLEPPPHAAQRTCSTRSRTSSFIATQTEAEALLAEQTFILQYRPRYNVRLRDDKSYPYIAISLDEDFPRVYFTREKHRRGRAYFGPFSNAKRVRADARPARQGVSSSAPVTAPEPGRASGSPCLDYFIKRCQAPCVGYVSKEEYRRSIESIVAFLSGRYRQIERDLEQEMKDAAAEAGVRAGGAAP